MHPSNTRESVHGLDGPDYVALVIEWDDDDHITMVSEKARSEPAAPMRTRTVATVLGALGAIALTTWGLRRLRPS